MEAATRLSPEAICKWWQQIARQNAYDTVIYDEAVSRLLREESDVAPEAERTARALDHLRIERPDIFAKYDYAFAFEPASYENSMEANFQLRLLEAISELDAFLTAQTIPLTGRLHGIVVRRTWAMNAFAARPLTPSEVSGVPVRFVVVPLGFVEAATLAFRALLSNDPAPVLKAILSIYLADALSDGLDPVTLRGIQRRMLKSVPVFAGSLDYIDGFAPTATESAWSFALLDFIMFHELGHIFYGDSADAANSAAIERRANEFATNVYAITWGFREKDMTLRGVASVIASAGGALAFVAATTLLLSSQSLLATRLATLAPGERRKRAASTYGNSFTANAAACEALMRYALPLQPQLVERGAATEADCRAMNAIIDRLGDCCAQIQALIARVSTDDLHAATLALQAD